MKDMTDTLNEAARLLSEPIADGPDWKLVHLRQVVKARLQTNAIGAERAERAGRHEAAGCRYSVVEALEFVIAEIDRCLATPEAAMSERTQDVEGLLVDQLREHAINEGCTRSDGETCLTAEPDRPVYWCIGCATERAAADIRAQDEELDEAWEEARLATLRADRAEAALERKDAALREIGCMYGGPANAEPCKCPVCRALSQQPEEVEPDVRDVCSECGHGEAFHTMFDGCRKCDCERTDAQVRGEEGVDWSATTEPEETG